MGMAHPIASQHLERSFDTHLNVGLASMQGYRRDMEDEHTIRLSGHTNTQSAFCAIFDGHNGQACSKWCSKHVWEYLNQDTHPMSVDKMQHQCIQADNAFLSHVQNDSSGHIDPSGSTAVMASLWLDEHGKTNVRIMNIGDSRAILCKANGEFIVLTTDHRPSATLECKRIVAAGGFVQNDRVNGQLAVSRAFGDIKFKCNPKLDELHQRVIAVPDVTDTLCLDPHDFLLLYCDGIVEKMTDAQVVEVVRTLTTTMTDLSAIMSELLNKVLESGSQDNMTAMIITSSSNPQFEKQQDVRFLAGPCDQSETEFVKAYTRNAQRYGYTLEQARAMIPLQSSSSSSSSSSCSLPSPPLDVVETSQQSFENTHPTH